jgi:hypothetical protein
MEFSIPTDLPVYDTGVELVENADAADASQSQLLQQRQTVAPDQAAGYLKKHDLVPLLNSLLGEVLVAEPEDPIDDMTRWFLRHGPTGAGENDLDDEERESAALALADRNRTVSSKHDTAVSYCARYCLPQLIDELLAAMISEDPPDQGRFAMSWLRWNKKKFIMRHKPSGYAAFIAAQEEDLAHSQARA